VARYSAGADSVPAMTVTAARTAAGAIAVGLVNLNPAEPIAVALTIAGASPRAVKGEILTAPTLDAHNTFENPDAVHPTRFTGASIKEGKLSLSLPAKSIVVLSLD
jgi:alpha-L-arabinofuranosidase